MTIGSILDDLPSPRPIVLPSRDATARAPLLAAELPKEARE